MTAALDIFQNHNRIIDNHPRCQNKGQQCQDIDRKAHHPDRGHRPDQRNRNGHRRNQRRGKGPQEQIKHADHDDNRQRQTVQNFPKRAFDKHRIVGIHENIDIVVLIVQAFGYVPNAVRYRNRVRLRLAHDAKPDHGPAIQTHIGRCIIGPVIDIRHIAQPDLIADKHLFDVFDLPDRRIGTDKKLLITGIKTAGGNVELGGFQDIRNVLNRKTVTGQTQRIDPDMQNLLAFAIDGDFGHTGHRKQRRADLVIHDIGKLFLGQAVADHGKAHDRAGIGIGLDHADILDLVRKAS